MANDRDYVLGTHEEELQRLGLQHRVWRPTVLECWRRAGIGPGMSVLDVGAGPGYAALDLAELVAPTGRVIAVERSARFLQAGRDAAQARGLTNIEFLEIDLMADALPATKVDATWCRWVACFVASPRDLVKKLAAALRPGGVAVFHEYSNYATWQLAPRRPLHEEFVRHVMSNWRDAGGEPDIALDLPTYLDEAGFELREATPRLFCLRPADEMWQWPASFVQSHPDRLVDLGRVSHSWADAVRKEYQDATADPRTLQFTPTVLELIAERRS
jgi:SAM-dependent methyltransferase